MILNIIHSFVNIFAGGRSDIKVYLFFIYLVFFSLLYLLCKDKDFKILKWRYFIFSVIAVYVYGLFLHIYFLISNHLSLTSFVITGNNGEISSSILWHSHIAKAIFGQVYSFFGQSYLPTMDAGNAYLGLIPSYVLLLGLVLFVAILVQVLLYFLTSFKSLLKNKNNRQKVFLIIGYIILSFSLIKTSIDGGVFNPSFGIGIIFIILFCIRLKGRNINNYYYMISLVCVILLFMSQYIDTFQYGNGQNIAAIAVFILLYLFILYFTEEKIRIQFIIPIFILFMAGWWMAGSRDLDIYRYSKILLQNGQQVLAYNRNKLGVEKIYINQEESIAKLSKQLNKNVTYLPITVPGVTCMEKGRSQEVSFSLIALNPIKKDSFIHSPYIKIKNSPSIIFGKNWKTEVVVSMDPCLPEPLSVLDGEFKKNNINTYLLVNPLFYDSSNFY